MQKIFGEKIEGIDYQLRKGVYAIIFSPQKNQVATVQLTRGSYFLPGGGLEDNESPEECLKREMLEETGYGLVIGPYIGNAQQLYYSSRTNIAMLNDGYFYLAEIGDKVQEPIEEDHLLKWIPVSEADKLLFHEHHIWAVKEGLKKQL
ncbi:NUDIX hydrolase [Planococcus sp. 1R117A]|uniref:NUDIX hydrolase n=1 Tax=Planococcus sp. 1R117A TaxID=3447020 RepID=UPI003EDC3ADF